MLSGQSDVVILMQVIWTPTLSATILLTLLLVKDGPTHHGLT